jgi:hypothetical protein
MAFEAAPYSYVAYIDEAGDPGLRKVKPRTANGSSEWIVLAGALIPAELEAETRIWVKEFRAVIASRQLRDIHFQKLNDHRKADVCRALTAKNVRLFAVVSNKQNMEGYSNPAAAQIPSNNWFYCWLTRVLLERMTDCALAASIKRYGEPRFMKIEFSERGGLSYSQMHAYYEWIRLKSAGGAVPLYLPWGKVAFEVLHPSLMRVYNHRERDGLKLPDIVASAFFKAVDVHDTGANDPAFARLLGPRMAASPVTGQKGGYGVKLWPSWTKLKSLEVPRSQLSIFEDFGYPSDYWWQANFLPDVL